ncbi:hypothetical protein OPT61_g940 [Boeremia exigua]|uniref:Uncharacterized protein n=1 Tax=Boeremia exigua TaxID=749465 RepID=A0ACC2ISD0_9PLEO|nr:hypothetical protein OPT61_g940 [Boeremia exigua]
MDNIRRLRRASGWDKARELRRRGGSRGSREDADHDAVSLESGNLEAAPAIEADAKAGPLQFWTAEHQACIVSGESSYHVSPIYWCHEPVLGGQPSYGPQTVAALSESRAQQRLEPSRCFAQPGVDRVTIAGRVGKMCMQGRSRLAPVAARCAWITGSHHEQAFPVVQQAVVCLAGCQALHARPCIQRDISALRSDPWSRVLVSESVPSPARKPRHRHRRLSRAAETTHGAPQQTAPHAVNPSRAQHTCCSSPRPPLRLPPHPATCRQHAPPAAAPRLADYEPARCGAASSSASALFSFTSPGSLFPPSAIISLTDDNSTFFLARPAAFGPDLPGDGLSGPLWIGSGFGDDALSRGELGCSDIPGWDGGSEALAHAPKPASTSRSGRTGPLAEKKDTPRRAALEEAVAPLPTNDGTDDHLHLALEQGTRRPSDYADIQSLQESAEIAGKVVLLKRGGCGFLAKVEWAQRRGGVAVIVGDDVRGGGLIRMYARGDTSNVTIPSLFTSHTTAHLLSSLLPSGKTLSGVVSSQQKPKPTLNDGLQSSHAPSLGSHNGPLASVETDAHGKSWLHSLLTTIGLASAEEQPTDSFRIGEDDWRDPRFRNLPTTTLFASPTSTPISPSSAISSNRQKVESKYAAPNNEQKAHWRSWLSSSRRTITSITSANSETIDTLSGDDQPHDGLWVTLTPTNVSSSPFFDTLLVLVVSPLVTLSVVYALLLLRSRIRRRRWRAPKSVVERLPVRTYHTISDSSSTPSAASEAATPTTPLLQRVPSRPTSSPSHSSSRDDPGAPATSSSVQRATRDREEEKRETGLAEWRRRYGGRQKECVVCLEEYVDGVSQVMSLPCGHEFHADCITPWLVTRRRTCPICKGDVVRSLSQAYLDHAGPSPPTPRLADDDHIVDPLQIQAAETRNDSPAASRPVSLTASVPSSHRTEPDDDVEANWSGEERETLARDIPGSRAMELSTSVRELSSTVSTVIWRGFDAVRITAGLQRRPPPEDVDRDR